MQINIYRDKLLGARLFGTPVLFSAQPIPPRGRAPGCQTAQIETQKEQIIVRSEWQKNSQIRINGRCRPKKQQEVRGDDVV